MSVEMKVRYIIRTTVIPALLVMLAAGITGCGGDDTDLEDLNKPPVTKAQRRDHRIKKDKEEARKKKLKAPKGGWIRSVKLTPQKQEDGTALKIETETATLDEEKGDRIIYIFWRNNQKSAEKAENLIPSTFYKRGDMVAGEVLYYRGDKILARKRSEHLYVENTSPVIKKVELPHISGPGTYSFKITANDEDGDDLTYTVAPAAEGEKLPEGFTIDNTTGTITFKLLESQKMPPVFKFVISANDGGGGIAKKAVTINLSSEKIIKKEEKKEGTDSGEEKAKS